MDYGFPFSPMAWHDFIFGGKLKNREGVYEEVKRKKIDLFFDKKYMYIFCDAGREVRSFGP